MSAARPHSARSHGARLHGASHPGFTLIELMLAVAIVAVLGAIALPHYHEYIRRGHRIHARAGLLQAQQWMERAATANGVYPQALPEGLAWSDDTGKRYTIDLQPGNTPSAYTLVATRQASGPQAGDPCGDFTLTHTGARGLLPAGAAPALVAECWNR